VRAARSVCWIPGRSSGAIVHALKYNGWSAVAGGMAERMARLDWPADVIAERAALVPVPLAPERERERGYNQSTLLADALAARWRIPVWRGCLARVRSTGTQTRLTPEQRRHNVSGAFRVPAPAHAEIRGAHLVLVDDVVTTGATLSECAAALFAAGARIMSIVTFGRAPASGDRP
jgi:ComF family protein